MTGDTDKPEEKIDDDGSVSDAVADGDIVADMDDNVGDLSVEINVEELVADIESSDPDAAAEKIEARKKLDEILEAKDKSLDDTYNFNMNDDEV